MLNQNLIDHLYHNQDLTDAEFTQLLDHHDTDDAEYLYHYARIVKETWYGKDVYIRGLIEFTNYCKNDCYYCGIRKSNKQAQRYRLTDADILKCCEEGYRLGFRTFVLQGGEDYYYTKEKISALVQTIRNAFPDCAITLSLGERDKDTYQAWYDAGADRYLLRHETANTEHYHKLHPACMSLSYRKECLYQLREIGYQVGAGFMVGSPYQTTANLIEDFRFLQDLHPHMIGIGPFISHKDTPFVTEENGTLEQTLFLLGILRLLFPKVLLPATTALGTIHPKGREMGLMAGGNVIMPNLSPVGVRDKYLLYDNKICTGDESAQCRKCLEMRIQSVGYQLVESRGDAIDSIPDTHL